jgi:hypothetical protein
MLCVAFDLNFLYGREDSTLEPKFDFDFKSHQQISNQLDAAFTAALFELAPPGPAADRYRSVVINGLSPGIYQRWYVIALI